MAPLQISRVVVHLPRHGVHRRWISLPKAGDSETATEFVILRCMDRTDQRLRVGIIVLHTEATANLVLSRLKGGEPFARLAQQQKEKSYVAISRLPANRHWFSDVVFGSAVGIIAGRTVTRHGREFPVTVAVVPGGAAITYVRRQ